MRTAVLILFLAPLSALADQIDLKTGERVVGSILRLNAEEICIQLKGGGIVSFRMDLVSNVRRSAESIKPPAPGPKGPVKERPPEREAPIPVPKEVAAPRPDPIPPPRVQGGEAFAMSFQPPKSRDGLATDPARRFAVAPPQGFSPWPEATSPTVPLAYRDPFTHSSFTVAAYPSSEPIVEVKKNSLRSYTENFTNFTVLRDDRLRQGDQDVSPETWLVEIESQIGGVSIRQLQVFTTDGSNAYLLSCSATADNYARCKGPFEKSIGTFHFLDAAGGRQPRGIPWRRCAGPGATSALSSSA